MEHALATIAVGAGVLGLLYALKLAFTAPVYPTIAPKLDTGAPVELPSTDEILDPSSTEIAAAVAPATVVVEAARPTAKPKRGTTRPVKARRTPTTTAPSSRPKASKPKVSKGKERTNG